MIGVSSDSTEVIQVALMIGVSSDSTEVIHACLHVIIRTLTSDNETDSCARRMRMPNNFICKYLVHNYSNIQLQPFGLQLVLCHETTECYHSQS